MTRTENDLRDALRDLDQQAERQLTPSTASIVACATAGRRSTDPTARRVPRLLAPLAAAAVVAAAGVGAVALSTSGSAPSPTGGAPALTPATSRTPSSTGSAPVASPVAPSTSPATPPVRTASAVLADAAAKLDAVSWTTPAPQDFFYVRTTDVTTWTSVNGQQTGRGRNANGERGNVPGCADGQFTAGSGQSGSCTPNDVARYLPDAPTNPAAWDAYLERMAPGAEAADAQGKIIVQVLHEDLTAPKARAALLRYTATCPGLHTVVVQPVTGQQLTGVTCTSMTNGSYGLVFDATSHALVGFVPVSAAGVQDYPAEIVRQTGIVTALGRRP